MLGGDMRQGVAAAQKPCTGWREHLCKRAALPGMAEPKQSKQGIRTGSGPMGSVQAQQHEEDISLAEVERDAEVLVLEPEEGEQGRASAEDAQHVVSESKCVRETVR